jgi:hypothetical protein
MRYSRGIWSYRVLHRAARYLGNLLYADMQLSITRMWQPAGSTKQLRWAGRLLLNSRLCIKYHVHLVSIHDGRGGLVHRHPCAHRTTKRCATGLQRLRRPRRASDSLLLHLHIHIFRRRVRWCVSGRPRFSPYADTEPQSTEVISTYAFDSHGKIYEHQVDQVIPPESMLVSLLL